MKDDEFKRLREILPDLKSSIKKLNESVKFAWGDKKNMKKLWFSALFSLFVFSFKVQYLIHGISSFSCFS